MSFFASSTFTLLHTALSLIGILAGLVALFGLFRNNPLNSWTLLFLVTTIATTLTGFLFPFRGFTPAIGTGIVSSLVLAPTVLARYTFNLAGAWRWIYVVGAVVSLYLNCFVLVVQSFLKVPALHELAPQGTEPAFVLTQGLVLVMFVIAGFLAVRRFHPAAAQPALAAG
ncbi:MAG TPA: hypothetical protein VJT80_20375 [Steroidobacteraceae bacterium]|nr:hypothetical protein [Steroidobacteraceae bacterium]